MNVGYVVWLEGIDTPYIKGQVLEILKQIKKISPHINIYFLAFVPFYRYMENRRATREIRDDLKRDGVNICLIPAPLFPRVEWQFPKWYSLPYLLISTVPALALVVALKKIDVLHCRSYPIMVPALTLKRLYGRLRVIFDPRSPYPEENVVAGRWSAQSRTYRMWKYLEKKYLEESDTVIAITDTYVEHYGSISPSARFELVPNNVDTGLFSPDKEEREHSRSELGVEDDEVLFVYAGSLGETWNNPRIYAAFIKELRPFKPRHRFLFVTPDVGVLLRVFRESGLEEEEYIVNKADLRRVPRHLNAGDFGLYLMQGEDIRLGIKSVEYLAMGLPLIVNSGVEGASEVVRKYDVGAVIEDVNIDIDTLEGLIRVKDDMAERCRVTACENFSNVVVAEKYARLYQTLDPSA